MQTALRLVFGVAWGMAVIASGRADSWAAPRPRTFAAEGGGFGFKVLEPRFLGTSTGVLFRRDAAGRETPIWSRQLVNVPHRVYVAPDGKRVVTIDTYGQLGYDHSLVVYDDQGKVLADYKLDDLMTPLEIDLQVMQTVSSRHWAVQAAFAFSPDRKHFVVTRKGAANLAEKRKELQDRLGQVKDKKVRARLRRSIAELEAVQARQRGGERVIRVRLDSGKLEDGDKSR